jgi:hypothetical protein
LRTLGQKKSAEFLRAQIGRQLRVLTLRSADSRHAAASVETLPHKESDYTPALSSNYLRVRLRGQWPANLWINVRVQAIEENDLIGEPVEPVSAELSFRAFA